MFYFLTFCICTSNPQLVKNPPAMQEKWGQSLGWEDSLETGKATPSNILAWNIPWTVHGVSNSQTWLSNFHFSMFYNYILIVYIRFINLAAFLLTGFYLIYVLKHFTRTSYCHPGFKSIKSNILIYLYTLID